MSTLRGNNITTNKNDTAIQLLESKPDAPNQERQDNYQPMAAGSILSSLGYGCLEIASGVVSLCSLITCDSVAILKHDYTYLTSGKRVY